MNWEIINNERFSLMEYRLMDQGVNTSKTDPLPPAQCDPLKILLTLG
jgi:hypothetical protein